MCIRWRAYNLYNEVIYRVNNIAVLYRWRNAQIKVCERRLTFYTIYGFCRGNPFCG